MDKKSKLEECVLQILEHGDPNKLTESKVRKLAGDETGLSMVDPANRKIVKQTVEDYFSKSQNEGSAHGEAVKTKGGEPPAKQPRQIPGRRRTLIVNDEDDEDTGIRTLATRSSNGNSEESEQGDASVESEEEDGRKLTSKVAKRRRADDRDADEVERVNGKKHTPHRLSESKKFPNGDDPVCELSKNRFVTVQNFNGKTLVSIREYYEKDGQLLPTRKGISLTVEQWEALKEGVPDIGRVIKEQRR